VDDEAGDRRVRNSRIPTTEHLDSGTTPSGSGGRRRRRPLRLGRAARRPPERVINSWNRLLEDPVDEVNFVDVDAQRPAGLVARIVTAHSAQISTARSLSGRGCDATTRRQTVSGLGSSSIAVADGDEGFGRRGSRTNESGGGSSIQKSPQRFRSRSSRKKRRKLRNRLSRHRGILHARLARHQAYAGRQIGRLGQGRVVRRSDYGETISS